MTDPLYAPGLKRRHRRAAGKLALYWIPPAKEIAAGFRPKSITISPDLSEEGVAAACRKHQADLEAWRSGRPQDPTRHTIAWLVERYLTDEMSPYQKLGFKSQRNYRQCCEIIRNTVGQRRVDPDGSCPRILGEDVWRWHKNWGRPGEDGKATAPSRARHVITQLRLLARYAVNIGVPGAKDMCDVLESMKFPTTAARRVVPQPQHVTAIVDTALELGWQSVAITTLAQFEFTERRISIIGSWEGDRWRAGWVWSGLSGRTRVGVNKDWIITYTQNKVGEVVREYDLKDTPLLLKLMQETPEAERAGPVIICETTGKPWAEKHYTDTFRKIARAAGVPDEICSMDMRAGGATETDSIVGITERDLKASGGWSSDVFNRYTRAPQRRAQNVVKLRQASRKTE